MLSTIILCAPFGASSSRDPSEGIVRTLAALVPAVIEGVIRDVTLAGSAAHGLARLADHAGCAFVEGANPADWLGQAIQVAKGPLLFVLDEGRAPESSFLEEAEDLMRFSERYALLHKEPETMVTRLLPRLAGPAGIILPREDCVGKSFDSVKSLMQLAKNPRHLRAFARRCG